VAVLGFAVGGAVWWPYFQLGSQNYTIAATDPRFWESRVRQCPPEADVFSLNYTLILDFWSMVYNINLRCYVDTMNKCN